MLYHPIDKNRILWDTWMYYENDLFHLFFLENIKGRQWDRIGHAVTTDFLYWKEYPSIMIVEDSENHTNMVGLTGSILKDDGVYYMTYALQTDKIQRIGIMRSTDLIYFEKYLQDEIECIGDIYETQTDEAVVHWRDPLLLKRGDYYEMIITARLNGVESARSGCLTRLRSKDLKNWEYMKPLAAPLQYVIMEVPDYFEINGTHYLLFSTFSTLGVKLKNKERNAPSGTFYLYSDCYDGSYCLPENNMLIGASDDSFTAYVGRTIPYKDTYILYHQIAAYTHASALPKLIRQNPDKSITAVYFDIMEKLKGDIIFKDFNDRMYFPSYNFYCCEDEKCFVNHKSILTGNSSLGTASTFFEKDNQDIFLEVTITAQNQCTAGIIHAFDGNDGKALVIDFNKSELSLSDIRKGQAGLTYVEKQILKRKLKINTPYKIKYISIDEYIEVYLDDEWLFTSSKECVRSGQTGFFAGNGCASFSEFAMYETAEIYIE